MRFLVIAFALIGFVASTGCTNTAAGFGKDLEKSGKAIQKTVGRGATTDEEENNGSNYNAYQAQSPQPLTGQGYGGATPSGY